MVADRPPRSNGPNLIDPRDGPQGRVDYLLRLTDGFEIAVVVARTAPDKLTQRRGAE